MDDIVVTVLDTDYIPDYATREEERINNEIARDSAESERIANENTRISNENLRQSNEVDRIAQYNMIQTKVENGDFNGADGQNGEDGYSPTVITSKNGRTTTITITDINGEHTATILDGEDGSASGDMLRSVYDTNNNGIVDNAEKVNNHTVQSDVPANAVFTDTVFSGNYNDLSNKPTIPSKTSDLNNDSGFITGYTETDPTVPSHVKGITQANITSWNNKSDFSGDYDDLTNKPDLTDYVKNTDYATSSKGGVVKTDSGIGIDIRNDGRLQSRTYDYNTYSGGSNNLFISKGTLENVIEGKGLISDTDYATNSKAGIIKASTPYASTVDNDGTFRALGMTYEQYIRANNGMFINKTTLENVITGKGLQIQLSTMPTASADNLDKIVQYTGTTDSTYTNGYFYKCVSDGASIPTYSWEEVEVQAGGGGASYTAGTNIEITNDGVINNTIPYTNGYNGGFALGINANSTMASGSTVIGINATANSKAQCAVIGKGAQVYGNNSIAFGFSAETPFANSIAIGARAATTKANQTMIGSSSTNINELAIYTSNGAKIMATEEFVQNYLTTLSTYDASKTQVLKNVNGTLTWVTEE